MIKNLNWPLMNNNISRKDLDILIEYLSMDNPKLTHGNKVLQFEKNWSDWLGTKNSVMVNSGSSANDLTMLAIREILGPGEIVVPPCVWGEGVRIEMVRGINSGFGVVVIKPRSANI